MKILLFAAPILVIALAAFFAYRQFAKGSGMKKAVRVNLATFALMSLLVCCLSFSAFAAPDDNTSAPPVSPAPTAAQSSASAASDNGKAMGYLSAALAVGLAGIGGGIAVAAAAPAAIGATSEDPKAFGKSIIFVALGEGIAIYGLIVSILIYLKL